MLHRMRPPPLKYAWNFYHDKHSETKPYDERITLILDKIEQQIFWGRDPRPWLITRDSLTAMNPPFLHEINARARRAYEARREAILQRPPRNPAVQMHSLRVIHEYYVGHVESLSWYERDLRARELG